MPRVNFFIYLIISVFVFIILYYFYKTALTFNVNYIENEFQIQVLDDVSKTQRKNSNMLIEKKMHNLKLILQCSNQNYQHEYLSHNDKYWMLKNFIKAKHGNLECYETITYTTHGDYTFLNNLLPLIKSWNAPISLAIYAPGTDFDKTINKIKFLWMCQDDQKLLDEFVTIHIYFDFLHMPHTIPNPDELFSNKINCIQMEKDQQLINNDTMYKNENHLIYPVNVGRNLARNASLTHFILASDIELYPRPNNLAKMFLNMIETNYNLHDVKKPKVFVLPIFEVQKNVIVPSDKNELIELLITGKAIPFHKKICSNCHAIPGGSNWMTSKLTQGLSIFTVGKRVGEFQHWEPIYIGTNSDPYYDDRLSWEGKSDKMTQGYLLCIMDYDFLILDNAFLVHRPGIKTIQEARRPLDESKNSKLIRNIILPELKQNYGVRDGCYI